MRSDPHVVSIGILLMRAKFVAGRAGRALKNVALCLTVAIVKTVAVTRTKIGIGSVGAEIVGGTKVLRGCGRALQAAQQADK